MFHLTLPVSGLTVWIPAIVLLGLIVGFLTGMFGVGGGFLLTPFLKVFFQIPYPIAVGSGLLLFFFTSSQSSFKHWRDKKVDVSMGVIMAAGALVGTEVGVRFLHVLGSGGSFFFRGHQVNVLDLVMSSLFLVLMALVVMVIIRETCTGNTDEVITGFAKRLQSIRIPPVANFACCGIPAMSAWVPLCMSFFVGILTGLLGIGGGFINFPLLVYGLGIPTAVAVGTSAFQVVFASAYGALRHGGQGNVEPFLVGMLFAGSLVGVQIGVYASKFCGGKKIRRYFSIVVGAGMLVVAVDIVGLLW